MKNIIKEWLFGTTLYFIGLISWIFGITIIKGRYKIIILTLCCIFISGLGILILFLKKYIILSWILISIFSFILILFFGLNLSSRYNIKDNTLIGMIGTALTSLNPKGEIVLELDGEKKVYKAISEGLFISKDAAVRVKRVGKKDLLVVEEIKKKSSRDS